jgi:hypothetical protein
VEAPVCGWVALDESMTELSPEPPTVDCRMSLSGCVFFEKIFEKVL